MALDGDELAAALAARPRREHPALPGRTNHLRAGVAVPLRWTPDGVSCVVTLRPTVLGRHGGEVSFPGGRPEPGEDLVATALRECAEEIGVRPHRVFGHLASMPIYTSDWRLEPVVVAIDGALRPDPGEVAEVHELDVLAIARAGVIEAVRVEADGGVFDMPVYRPGGWLMYGATALTFTELVTVVADVLGLPAPRFVPSPLGWREVVARRARAGTPPG